VAKQDPVQLDYGIQPNQKRKEQSFIDFTEKTTWFRAMTKALQRHSEFMRPELGDFPAMEYDYPPIYDLPRDQGGGDVEVDPGKVLCPGCFFTTNKFLGPLGNKDSQICFPYGGKICMTPTYDKMYSEWKKTGNLPEEFHGTWPTQESTAAAWAGGKFTWVQIKGTSTPIRLIPPEDRYWSGGWCIGAATVGYQWPVDTDTTIRVTFTDVYGNICTDDAVIRVMCEDDPTTVALTFDDASTPDTITKGTTITMYVLDGCLPITWTVSGAGYTLGAPVTYGRNNTLRLANYNCGAQAAASAAITATDKAGTTVSFNIKNTAAGWVNHENDSSDSNGNCWQDETYDLIVGLEKWVFSTHYAAPAGVCNDDDIPWWSAGTMGHLPPCGTATTCAELYSTFVCGGACEARPLYQYYMFYQWGCI